MDTADGQRRSCGEKSNPSPWKGTAKLRAFHEGRKLKYVAADLLKRGLSAPETAAELRAAKPEIEPDGRPVIRCSANAPAYRMSTEQLLSLDQERFAREDFQWLCHAL